MHWLVSLLPSGSANRLPRRDITQNLPTAISARWSNRCKSLILQSIPNGYELEPLRVLPQGAKPFADNEMGRLEARAGEPEILLYGIVS
jgi:hypothetical protein